MALGTVRLPILGCVAHDGSSGDEFPEISIHTSGDSNDPHCRIPIASCDDTQEEYMSWSFRVPSNYGSGGILRGIFWMDSAIADDVLWQAALQCVTPGDATDMEQLDVVNQGGGWAEDAVTVPATAGYLAEFEIDMSGVLDGMAAGDFVVLVFTRGAGDSQDTATGDAKLVSELQFDYTIV